MIQKRIQYFKGYVHSVGTTSLLAHALRKIISTILLRAKFIGCEILCIMIGSYTNGSKYTHIGSLTAGRNFRFRTIDRFYIKNYAPKVNIGKVSFGHTAHAGCIKEITIAQNDLFGMNIKNIDLDHGNYSCNSALASDANFPPFERELFSRRIIIGDNVVVGENGTIFKGVIMGNRSVDAASSVVTKSFKRIL